MKLRNKKTGETGYLELEKGDDEKYTGLRVYKNDFMYKRYDSLAGVLEEWEDYKPAEPLIKDEKIRKAVRAWWETIPDAVTDKRVIYKNNHDFAVGIYSIYCGAIYPETLEVGKMYTITELCGEEEE